MSRIFCEANVGGLIIQIELVCFDLYNNEMEENF